jgi:IMP dehydrogenase
MKECLTFDDVQIVPKYSEIKHRADADLTSRLTKEIVLKIPIVSSPMDTITEFEMAWALAHLGGIGFIHRFMDIEKQVDQTASLGAMTAGAAIGVTGDYFERAQELVNNGCNVLFIDVAHGHHKLVKEAIRRIKNELTGTFELIGGSIATKEAAQDLCDWGVDGIRVGIGNGSLCETRIRTGVGIPQSTAILDVYSVCDTYDVPMVADGGIRNIGDVCKGLGCGADTIMLGSLLSGTKETPGDISKVGLWPNEKLYKKYRGSASVESKLDRGEDTNVEGNSKVISYKGKTKRIINDIMDGLKSSMSYVGASNLEEYRSMVEFIKVTQSGVKEAFPFGMDRE